MSSELITIETERGILSLKECTKLVNGQTCGTIMSLDDYMCTGCIGEIKAKLNEMLLLDCLK